jgi:hypothetical protein
MSEFLVKAIKKLKPEAEFSFSDNDYSTIKWDVLDGNAPTEAEILEAIEQVKADDAQAELAKAAKKAATEAKLASLGLDADDLKALGLG